MRQEHHADHIRGQSTDSGGSRGGGARGRAPPPCRQKKKKKKEEEEKEKQSALGFVKSDHSSTMSEGRLNALLRLSVSTRTYTWILKKWWRHTGINIQEECCWVDRWMHDLLHVEHLFFDLPDFPSDFKYFVKIVNICTNYLANSLSDFSEIIPQNSEKCISAHPNFQNSPGEHAPRTPLEGARAGPRRDRVAITSFGVLEFHAPPPPPPPVTQILDPPLQHQHPLKNCQQENSFLKFWWKETKKPQRTSFYIGNGNS